MNMIVRSLLLYFSRYSIPKEYAALNLANQPMESIEEQPVPSLECDEAVIEVQMESDCSSPEAVQTSYSYPLVHTASHTPSYPMFNVENFS